MVTNPRWVSRKGFRGHLQTLEVFSRELGDGGGGLQQAEGRVSLSKAQESGPGRCDDHEEQVARSW